jgi:Uma2 family endonuclease
MSAPVNHFTIEATGVSAEDYLANYAADFYEWVQGKLIKMPPVSLHHNDLTAYLDDLLSTYFHFRPIGRTVSAPFVMTLESTQSRREPDLQVILKTNPGKLTDTQMIGPADICIEVVSPESDQRDHGEKFVEYEQGGVGEYWIVDRLRNECRFYRLNENKRYQSISTDDADSYTTPLLPDFALHVPTLWQHPLPSPPRVVEMISNMLCIK